MLGKPRFGRLTLYPRIGRKARIDPDGISPRRIVEERRSPVLRINEGFLPIRLVVNAAGAVPLRVDGGDGPPGRIVERGDEVLPGVSDPDLPIGESASGDGPARDSLFTVQGLTANARERSIVNHRGHRGTQRRVQVLLSDLTPKSSDVNLSVHLCVLCGKSTTLSARGFLHEGSFVLSWQVKGIDLAGVSPRRVVNGGGDVVLGILDGDAAVGLVVAERGAIGKRVQRGNSPAGGVVDRRDEVLPGVFDLDLPMGRSATGDGPARDPLFSVKAPIPEYRVVSVPRDSKLDKAAVMRDPSPRSGVGEGDPSSSSGAPNNE